MYAAAPDPYCYQGTNVLKNTLGLTDQARLDAFEADAVTQRGTEALPMGRLTATHLRRIHRHLFQDVYAWAGQFRTIRLGKGGSVFCYPEHIVAQVARLFGWLQERENLAGLEADAFAELGAHFLSELNAIHPFREGNGRTQMAFFAVLADHAKHRLDLARLDPRPFLDAMVGAFNGDEASLTKQIRTMI